MAWIGYPCIPSFRCAFSGFAYFFAPVPAHHPGKAWSKTFYSSLPRLHLCRLGAICATLTTMALLRTDCNILMHNVQLSRRQFQVQLLLSVRGTPFEGGPVKKSCVSSFWKITRGKPGGVRLGTCRRLAKAVIPHRSVS